MRHKEPPLLTSYVDEKGDLVLSQELTPEDTDSYYPVAKRHNIWPYFLAGLLLGISVMTAILWWKGII
jgi:hypothetical protein